MRPRNGSPAERPDQQERRRQVRGLLCLAAAALAVLVYRAATQGAFHAGWWRI